MGIKDVPEAPTPQEPESEEVRAFDQKQCDAMLKDAFSMERLTQLGGGKDAPRNMPIPPLGPMEKYRVKPLKKLPPELREPTVFQRAMSYLRERKERKEKEKQAEQEMFLKQFQNETKARPYTVFGITIDPNLPLPSQEEREAELADWKRWQAKRVAAAAALARGEGMPILFLLDEFGTIGKLSAISTAYGLMRGAGICMWAFVQDFNQLRRDYSDEWETFVGNVTALICFGIMDQFTCEYVSKLMGTMTMQYETKGETGTKSTRMRQRTMDDIVLGMFGDPVSLEEDAGSSTSENTTEHVVERPLCPPDIIRRMHPQKCIVIGHSEPALCERVDYYRDPTFSSWARPDPKYQ
jgi:hypothetical protein